MVDRKQLRELRDATWASVDDLRAFVESVGALSRKDVEALVEVMLDPGLERSGPYHKNRCSAFRAICLAAPDASHFVPLANAIVKADPMLRRALAAILPRANDVQHHGILCVALGSSDPDARATASAVLEQVGGPSALRELVKLVAQPSFAGRREALDVMVPKARHRAFELVEAVLRHGNARERQRAVELLGDPALMSGEHDAALAHLVRALEDPDRNVSAAAVQGFAALAGPERFVEALEPKVQADDVSPVLVEALGLARNERSVALLNARIRRGPTAVQLAALSGLRAIGTPSTVEGLVEALHVEDPLVQRSASDALTELGASGAIDVGKILLVLLGSPHPHVRRTAAQLAASVRKDLGELTPKLLAALRDESWWVRERVLDAIVELNLPELANGLAAYLADESPIIRRYAIFGLLRLRDPATLGALLRVAVTDPDWWVREQAVQAVGELGDERAVPYLKAMIEERWDLRVAALEALVQLRADDTLLALGELTGDEDASVRSAMIEVLGKLERGRTASFYVQSCLNDPDRHVAKQARAVLDRWKIETESESASVGLLNRLLVAAARHGADDLLLSPTRPPYVKHLGSVTPISKGVLSPEEMERMLLPILSEVQRHQLAAGQDVDLSYDVPGFDLRYRINVFRQYTGLSAVFRRIHQVVPALADLGLPPVVKTFADYPNGLVLVGGPTGSGKSTTLAALIDYINGHVGGHIVTIEDPIEVLHPQRVSLVNQREVGTHAPSFAAALRATLRQDPDVILVGELRDRETIEFAVNAAETGHLVLATVHTTSAATTVDRLIHACEAARQPVIRSMLAESLRAVLCQQLLRRKDDNARRVLACEVLINNDAVSNLIRKDKSFQLPTVMLTHGEIGMQLMDDDLQRLVRSGTVDPDEAMLKALDKSAFTTFVEALRAGKDSGTSSIPPRRAEGYSQPPPSLRSSKVPTDLGTRTPVAPPGSARGGGTP
jgi:twitching motility protein PilT